MEAISNKSLWTLVSGEGLKTEKDIIETELLGQKSLLREGLLSYRPNTAQTLQQFQKGKEVGESWKDFVIKLAGLVRIDEVQSWELLCNYLSTEYRGTSDSLAQLLKKEAQARPLLLDIWKFYRAERLYLLQVLKDIITFFNDKSSPNQGVFESVLDILEVGEGLRARLIRQLEGVMGEAAPDTVSLGAALGRSCREAWIHFNLREQSELLQLLLLLVHQTGRKELQDFTELADLFSSHEFGTKQQFRSEMEEQSICLVEGVGRLEAAILVLVMDLPSISSRSEGSHPLFPAAGTVPALERFISGLGNLPAHGPPMLAYMLGKYLSQGQDGLASASRFGEAAIAGNVLRTLLATLKGDFSRCLVSDILHSLAYSLTSTLVSAFDPCSLGLSLDTHSLVLQLVSHSSIAQHFWKLPGEGLGLYFSQLGAQWPYQHRELLELATSLASASPSSCSSLLPSLSSLPSFTEATELVPASARSMGEGTLQLEAHHCPYPGTQSVSLPSGTRGSLSPSGSSVTWHCPVSAWQCILADCGHLASQATSGAGAVCPTLLARVTSGALLVSSLLATSPSLAPQLAQLSSSLLHCCTLLAQLPSPPLQLVAAVTAIFSSLAQAQPAIVLARLLATPLLPSLRDGALQPGTLGCLLARQESVAGEYPALLAFLQLCTVVAGCQSSGPAMAFLLQEVIPHYSKWRYERPGDREKVARLCLTAVLAHTELEEGLARCAQDRGLARALLSLASTGDRAIQMLLEGQTNWEVGRGADLAAIVHLALRVLHRLVTASPLPMAGPVGAAIRAPPQGGAPHLLLTLAHYTYFFHLPELAIAGVELLSAIARDGAVCGDSPVSVLACLADSAASVKEMLLSRLESSTEDIRLKIALVKLLAACVEQQPGMVQLLMDLNMDIKVVEGGPGAVKAELGSVKGGPAPAGPEGGAALVGEGCLAPVLRLLAQCGQEDVTSLWLDLHLGIVELVDGLWSRGRLLAAHHLKDQPQFWPDLCRPLTEPRTEHTQDTRGLRLRAFVLRILSTEVYTWRGALSPQFSAVIEQICRHDSPALATWCHVEEGEGATSDDSTLVDGDSDECVPLFLLSSWRAFLLVLAKDSPSSLPPASCRAVFGATVSRLGACLALSPPPPRLTTILGETAVVLARRWRTKCSDTMETWCGDMAGLLHQVAACWSSLHPRARLAVLGLGLATARISHCKLDQREGEVLGSWLTPALALLATNMREVEAALQRPGPTQLQGPELCLALLQVLLARLAPSCWLPALHSHATSALLLSATGACCKARAAPSLTLSTLALLLDVGDTPQGAALLLSQDLARDVWLPVSLLPQDTTWQPVRQAALHLAGSLVRVARRPAVSSAVTLAALASEQLVTDLLSPRQDLTHLPRAAAAASFLSCLAPYTATWRAEHPASLLMLYRAACRLLHTATSLLMRPSLLSSLVRKDTPMEEARRVRSLSTSTSCTELELEGVGPEAAPSYLLLLEMAHGCLALVASLSPPLPELLAGTALHDPDRWEPLLLPSFSGPTLEQDGDTPSYGLLLALANVSVRTLARDGASQRSPSPGRAGAPSPVRSRPASAPPPDSLERRRLALVLERSLTLLLEQALLSLALGSESREKQLLRRELGAELGSVTDTWRRHLHRGGRSPGPGRGTKSPSSLSSRGDPPSSRGDAPGPPTSPSPQGRCSRADTESFMKFVSQLVKDIFK